MDSSWIVHGSSTLNLSYIRLVLKYPKGIHTACRVYYFFQSFITQLSSLEVFLLRWNRYRKPRMDLIPFSFPNLCGGQRKQVWWIIFKIGYTNYAQRVDTLSYILKKKSISFFSLNLYYWRVKIPSKANFKIFSVLLRFRILQKSPNPFKINICHFISLKMSQNLGLIFYHYA